VINRVLCRYRTQNSLSDLAANQRPRPSSDFRKMIVSTQEPVVSLRLLTDHALSTLVFRSGNFTASAWSKVGFVNFNGGDGGDYHRQQSSPYHDAGNDGRVLGADINAVDSAKSFAE
jgi:hypothetical protein